MIKEKRGNNINNVDRIITFDAVSYMEMLNQMPNGIRVYFEDNGIYGSSKTMLPVILPAECPCCGHIFATDLAPIIALNNIKDDKQTDCKVISIYRCTNCNEFFVVHSKNHCKCGLLHHFGLYDEDNCSVENIHIYPFDMLKTEFETDIMILSPDFVKIYQAELAEKQSLSSICGMGYRKALEFLIRDYCIHFHPDKTMEIDSKPLAIKISDYVADTDIKCLAEGAVWLENDPDNMIDDIKLFINVAVVKIHAELVAESVKAIQKVKGEDFTCCEIVDNIFISQIK